MYCSYIVTYLGDKLPPKYPDEAPPMYYLGSSTEEQINKGYRGSVKSKKYKDIWESELRDNPELFQIEIINRFNTNEQSKTDELSLQIEFNVVKSPEFVNMALATVNGCFGMPMFGEDNPRYGKTNSEYNKQRSKEVNTGKIQSEEFKQARRDYVHTAEARNAISIALTGRECSEETRGFISIALTGVKHTEERKANMRKPKTEEHKANISLAQKGKKRKPLSDEHKEKLSLIKKGKFRMFDLITNKYFYASKLPGSQILGPN